MDGVYFVDGTRKILYWNAAAERLTGFPASEVVGRCCHDDLLRHVNDLSERYRLLVQYSDLLAEGQRVRVTASIGATLARRDDTVESLLKRADGLMHQSKQVGRNRTTSEASVAAA